MGRPAASALVQPAGRRWFESRFHTAPEPACQAPLLVLRAANSSYSLQALLSMSSMCRSLPGSMRGLDGMGYLTRSDSPGHRKVTVRRGVADETMFHGMP